MSDQPEALRLADRLEGRWALHPEMQQAATELRRQHDEIESLRQAYNIVTDDCRNLTEKVIPNIRAERDAAVKALKWLDRWLGHKPMPECTAKIKAAINAARSKT